MLSSGTRRSSVSGKREIGDAGRAGGPCPRPVYRGVLRRGDPGRTAASRREPRGARHGVVGPRLRSSGRVDVPRRGDGEPPVRRGRPGGEPSEYRGHPDAPVRVPAAGRVSREAGTGGDPPVREGDGGGGEPLRRPGRPEGHGPHAPGGRGAAPRRTARGRLSGRDPQRGRVDRGVPAGGLLPRAEVRAPVVPVYLDGGYRAIPKGGFRVRPAGLLVRVLPPLSPEEGAGGSKERIAESVRARLLREGER